jgi:hypothetical protein
MFGAIHYGTAVYRNELCRRMHALAYATRATAHGFEIEGVDPKLIDRYSKRAQERRAAVAKEEDAIKSRNLPAELTKSALGSCKSITNVNPKVPNF